MKFIKEYCQASQICVIRTDNYGSTLQKFLDFLKEAQKDFPQLTPATVEIVHFGGERYKHTFGLEFKVPTGASVPNTYSPINQLEFTL